MLISKKTLNNLEKRLNNLEKAFLKLLYIQSKRNSDFPCSKFKQNYCSQCKNEDCSDNSNYRPKDIESFLNEFLSKDF